MIEIKDRKDCCGCNACVQKCPKQCIVMQIDDEGFNYPNVDKSSCVDCGLCEKICPVINIDKNREPIKCVAAKGKREEFVRKSSSAGVFYLLAEKTIQQNGVVFGARFNEKWDVVHSWTDDIEGIAPFLSSKYVQSQIGETYKQAEFFLKEGKKVLFSGTPCQIAGLRHYLRKDYETLLCVDVICHGVPSPGVWREYLKNEILPFGQKNIVSSSIYSPLSESDALQIKGVTFRDKRLGWKKYSFVLYLSQGLGRSEENLVSSFYKPLINQKHYHNLYMKAFLYNLTLRQSCFACPTRKGKSGSDISLGDYWGIAKYHPDFYTENGISMVLAYTEKGVQELQSLDLDYIDIHYFETKGNLNIEVDEPMPIERDLFFVDFRTDGIKAMKTYVKKMSGSPLKIYGKAILYKFKMLFK